MRAVFISRLVITKFIRSAPRTANRDEIDRAEAAGEMRRVIQLFPYDERHPAIIPQRWQSFGGAVHANGLG
jgi:hypothetical protein